MPPEDGIAATDRFIAVVDGSTSKSAMRLRPDMTNGRYCMSLICDYIAHAASDISCADFCQGVTEHIRNHYAPSVMQHLASHPEDRMTASCAIYSDCLRQIWMIGDCQCLVDNKRYDNPKPCEQSIAEKRALIAGQLLSDAEVTTKRLRTDDLARSAIMQDLIESMKGQNKDYSVIDGFDIPLDKVRIISIPDTTNEIVLASDGYPQLMPSLKESEEALRLQMERDPLNIRTFKATKGFMAGNNSFDDRTYIRFAI